MFSPEPTERKALKKVHLHRNNRLEEASPKNRWKGSMGSSEKSRRTVARSPKSYVKENK